MPAENSESVQRNEDQQHQQDDDELPALIPIPEVPLLQRRRNVVVSRETLLDGAFRFRGELFTFENTVLPLLSESLVPDRQQQQQHRLYFAGGDGFSNSDFEEQGTFMETAVIAHSATNGVVALALLRLIIDGVPCEPSNMRTAFMNRLRFQVYAGQAPSE